MLMPNKENGEYTVPEHVHCCDQSELLWESRKLKEKKRSEPELKVPPWHLQKKIKLSKN